jgi:hypothetical protein
MKRAIITFTMFLTDIPIVKSVFRDRGIENSMEDRLQDAFISG